MSALHLLVRAGGRRFYVAITRPHSQVRLSHADSDLAALIALGIVFLGIVTEAVLASKLFGDSGEGLRQLRGVIGFVEPAAGFVRQRVQVLICTVVISLRRAWNRGASVRRRVIRPL